MNSISYGGIEEGVAASVTTAFNTAAMKLGFQGVSVFVSSGEDSVGNFQARAAASGCGYHPRFPASSPYVTAVGATQEGINGGEEIVRSSDTGGSITTGGGFAAQYDMPSYQGWDPLTGLGSVDYLQVNGKCLKQGVQCLYKGS